MNELGEAGLLHHDGANLRRWRLPDVEVFDLVRDVGQRLQRRLQFLQVARGALDQLRRVLDPARGRLGDSGEGEPDDDAGGRQRQKGGQRAGNPDALYQTAERRQQDAEDQRDRDRQQEILRDRERDAHGQPDKDGEAYGGDKLRVALHDQERRSWRDPLMEAVRSRRLMSGSIRVQPLKRGAGV